MRSNRSSADGDGVALPESNRPCPASVTTDSKRSYIADLDSNRLKPAGWDRHAAPKVPAQTDMVIYELHVRDFSANDTTSSLRTTYDGMVTRLPFTRTCP